MSGTVEEIIRLMKLREHFPSIDPDLVALACHKSGKRVAGLGFGTPQEAMAIRQRLKDHHGLVYADSTNYEVLEFYGDRVLEMAVIDNFKDFVGLNATPGDLDPLKTGATKNTFLTKSSTKLGVCQLLARKEPKSRHNICSDSFEAIIGAVYFQFGLASLPRITTWLNDLQPFERFFDDLMTKTSEIHGAQVKASFPPLQLDHFRIHGNARAVLDRFIAAYIAQNPSIDIEEGVLTEGDPLIALWLRDRRSETTKILATANSAEELDPETFYAEALETLRADGILVRPLSARSDASPRPRAPKRTRTEPEERRVRRSAGVQLGTATPFQDRLWAFFRLLNATYPGRYQVRPISNINGTQLSLVRKDGQIYYLYSSPRPGQLDTETAASSALHSLWEKQLMGPGDSVGPAA